MLEKIQQKHTNIILYAVFGVLTTIVNLVFYRICYGVLDLSNVASTVIAWIVAVAFAFITNKLWVFRSRSFDIKIIVFEVITFFIARIATGIFDVAIMYAAVDVLEWNSTIWKLISNVIVIILNYISSKHFVFRKT